MLYLLSVIISFVLVFLFLILNGGSRFIINYLDMPALTFIILPTVAVLFGGGQLRAFFNSFRIITSNREKARLSQIRASRGAVSTAMKAAIASGCAGFAIGIIALFYVPSDPSTVGPSIAVATLSLLYASLIPLILLPVTGRLQTMELNYISTETDTDIEPAMKKAGDKANDAMGAVAEAAAAWDEVMHAMEKATNATTTVRVRDDAETKEA